jgi:hypothetical protein
MSLVQMSCSCRNPRLRLGLFDVKMCLRCDLEKAYFPLPVFRNRLAAERLVLILGMVLFSSLYSAVGGRHPPALLRYLRRRQNAARAPTLDAERPVTVQVSRAPGGLYI